MVHITIDNKELAVDAGERIIDICDAHATPIPRFCYHKELTVAANCRMCLVEVEGSPKLQPSCTLTATDGLVIHTKSPKVQAAQQSVMELLLINHPLDCPICDQGGECELQDVAIAYGSNKTFYHEPKRVVVDENIGDFIQTDLTRCIHCMRCVRFGSEVAGLTELGATGRGEHMKISAFLETTIDSELSGNMIDICPVGALTSKPYRYSIRSWQMTNHESIARHDTLGSNLNIQIYNNQVYRVSSRENPEVNMSWISDRDRFSYLSLQSEQRVLHPLITISGETREASWEAALEHATKGIKNNVVTNNKGYALAVFSDPSSTYEELSLLKQLATELGSEHTESIFQKGHKYAYLPSTVTTADIGSFKHIVILGNVLDISEPVIHSLVKKANDTGSNMSIIAPTQSEAPYPFTFIDSTEFGYLAALESVDIDDQTLVIITSDVHTESDIGALHSSLSTHPHILNVSVSGNIGSILSTEFSSTTLLDESTDIDVCILHNITYTHLPMALQERIQNATFVVSLDVFAGNEEVADVVLPVAGLYETPGTFININNTIQHANQVVTPPGEAKEAWKVIKVLADSLELAEFGITSHLDVSYSLMHGTLEVPQPGELKFVSTHASWDSSEQSLIAIDPYVRHTDILMRRLQHKGYYVG